MADRKHPWTEGRQDPLCRNLSRLWLVLAGWFGGAAIGLAIGWSL